jgi:hypothetical protein
MEIIGSNSMIKNLGTNNIKEGMSIVWARPFHLINNPAEDGSYRLFSTGEYFLEETEHCSEIESHYNKPNFELIYLIFFSLFKILGSESARWLLSKNNQLSLKLIETHRKFNDYNSLKSLFIQDFNKRKNLALNAVASQSSFSFHSNVDDACGGCNGLITGSFGFHTNLEFNPWWSVDLGHLTSISAVVIYNRMDAGSHRANHLRLFFSVDGDSWKLVYDHKGRSVIGGYLDEMHNPLIVPFTVEIFARYVKVDLPGEAILHLDEIQVY